MYTSQDLETINARLRKTGLVLAPVLLVILAAYIYALAARVRWLALAAGALLFVAACYGFLARLWPDLRYRRFLLDMESGLSRELRGTILSVSDAAELQDGAMVLPVRLRLEPEAGEARLAADESAQARRLAMESGEDVSGERIVYLNASKRDQMPSPGATVRLRCFGRHIRSAEAD